MGHLDLQGPEKGRRDEKGLESNEQNYSETDGRAAAKGEAEYFPELFGSKTQIQCFGTPACKLQTRGTCQINFTQSRFQSFLIVLFF